MRYEIQIERITYGDQIFTVEADSREEAVQKAKQEALNADFREDEPEYETVEIVELP